MWAADEELIINELGIGTLQIDHESLMNHKVDREPMLLARPNLWRKDSSVHDCGSHFTCRMCSSAGSLFIAVAAGIHSTFSMIIISVVYSTGHCGTH